MCLFSADFSNGVSNIAFLTTKGAFSRSGANPPESLTVAGTVHGTALSPDDNHYGQRVNPDKIPGLLDEGFQFFKLVATPAPA